MGKETLKLLKQILADSNYTVIVCGSGMMEEGGILRLREEGRAYKIRQTYDESLEELLHISCFSGRLEIFYDFYKKEVPGGVPSMAPSMKATAEMKRQGKLQCAVTTSTFDLLKTAGVGNVTCLHGGIYDNICIHCDKEYSTEYMKNSEHIPLCGDYGHIICLGTFLYGGMVDSGLMSRAAEKISRVEVLLVLGTSLQSKMYSHYIRYFQGGKMIIIHRAPRSLDEKADVVIYDLPQNTLPLLVEEK